MKKILFEDACILSAIKFARFWARVLPLRVSYWIAKRIGSALFYLTARRRIAHKNLRMAYSSEKSSKELRLIAKLSIQNLTISAIEMLRIPELTRQDVERRFVIEGRENFEPYLARGQGIIFLTGHFGSWEILNIVSGLVGYPMVALARVQKHPRSDSYLNDLRRSKGSQVIHKGMPVREILRALKKGEIVGILSDQDGGRQGRFVNFFNRLSSTPAGAAIFSMRTQSPIFPSFIVREKNMTFRIVVEKPIPMPDPSLAPEEAQRQMLQCFADSLERQVRRHPEQWLWAHRRWKSSPDRRVVILSDGKAGHLNQSRAVLEAIRNERKAHGLDSERVFSKVIEPVLRNNIFARGVRTLSVLLRGHLPFRRRFMRALLEKTSYDELLRTYADIVISCGSSLADINLWVKKENAAKSVVVMKPSIASAHFDAVVAPRHDRMKKNKNIFITDGALSAFGTQDLELEASALAAQLELPAGQRRVGVFVGGDTRSLRFDTEIFVAFMESVREFCQKTGSVTLLTTSRRTPVWAQTFLKALFGKRSLCPLLLIENESNQTGAVAGILGLSDILVVTAESVSMISEAVSTGKPVLVIGPWKDQRMKKKYENYLEHLEKDGLIVVCRAGDLAAQLENWMSSRWTAADGLRRREEGVLADAARRVL